MENISAKDGLNFLFTVIINYLTILYYYKRLISASNKLKSVGHSSMNLDTENM